MKKSTEQELRDLERAASRGRRDPRQDLADLEAATKRERPTPKIPDLPAREASEIPDAPARPEVDLSGVRTAMEKERGEPGPRGERGPRGPEGPRGPAGPPADEERLLPEGGEPMSVLAKKSAESFDVAWLPLSGGGGGGTGPKGDKGDPGEPGEDATGGKSLGFVV